ncbi:hypothetical protein CPB83DRAFT_895880 [Crepidotus variabilis]|uniref:Uncharacterized protein n=1 Tax=Crepidotus variabilis TaxID=179855 RepID=A0A9P6JNJ0_9AGAR|nr:hypothetical protein CPB83DRAFT_895880 [Crepidotus variabilis]
MAISSILNDDDAYPRPLGSHINDLTVAATLLENIPMALPTMEITPADDMFSGAASYASFEPPSSAYPSSGSSQASPLLYSSTDERSVSGSASAPASPSRSTSNLVESYNRLMPNAVAKSSSSSEYDGGWSNSDLSAEISCNRPCKYIKAGKGTSKSAVHSPKRRKRLKEGTLRIDPV